MFGDVIFALAGSGFQIGELKLKLYVLALG